MIVVHIIESLRSGGKERQLLELVRGTIAAGHDPQVIVMSDAIEYDVGDLEGRIHCLPRRSRRDPGLVLRMRKLVKALRPDVIHSWGTMCSVYAVPVSGFGRIPLVAGHIRDAPSHLPRTDKRWWHGRIAQPFAGAIVANSRAGLTAYRVSGPRAHVIYNGFDFAGRVSATDGEFRRTLGITTPHAVAMVARFGSHKDHDTFFAAARAVLAERADVTFLAVGDGPGLKEWQARLADEPRIILTGRRGDVERIVAQIDVGVLLTRVGDHGEGISNALTEILAAGKPVIATDDGGNRELVGDHGCGMLIAPFDPKALADALGVLLDQPELAKRLGATGRDIVLKKFSLESMVSAYLELYKRILKK